MGSVTLTDSQGHKHTLKDVVYVPSSAEPILSLMKLKKTGFGFHFLDDHDEGDFLLSNKHSHFEVVGHAVEDIIWIKETPSTPQVNAVTTRFASQRKA
jgi:hypothetical protein